MKLGLGFNSTTNLLCDDNLKFARQIGVTHVIVHTPAENLIPSAKEGYWSYEDLNSMREYIESFGLKLEGIENFLAQHWDQILLDGPGRDKQMENIKKIIRNMGKAKIPVMGYNFSLAGVWGRVNVPGARGGAMSPGYFADKAPEETLIPHGFVWNRQIDDNPPPGNIGTVSHEEMWERITYFLQNIIPVAEEAGVMLAAHPEDPPKPVLRGTARLLTNPENYDRLFGIVPSKNSGIELCQGTFTEMPGVDVYEVIRKFASMGKIGYVHFRNVKGKLPNYCEVFLDEGDIDMLKALQIYKECGYNGVLIPDHTPSLDCPAPWHAGMAYAIGYMRALMKFIGIDIVK